MRRAACALALAALFVTLAAAPAAAHAAFESSDPVDASQAGAPVATVTLTFTLPVEPTGGGFEALDDFGEVRPPSSVESADGVRWELTFDPPLRGNVGVRWEVRAPDAHPFTGAIAFEAAIPDTPASDLTGAAATTNEAPPPVRATGPSGPTGADLDAFLEVGSAPASVATRLGTVGRVVTVASSLLAVGALVFAVVVMRGAPAEFRRVMFWLRRFGLALAVGTLVEGTSVALTATSGAGSYQLAAMGDALYSLQGIALGVRLLGAISLLGAARVPLRAAESFGDPVVRIRELVGAGVEIAGLGDRQPVDPQPYRESGDTGWVPNFTPAHPVLGACLVLASFAFDGHTVSTATWSAMAILDVIHVAAAAVWVGGLAMLVVVMGHRRAQGLPVRARQLALRFSVVAAAAVAAAGAAGAAMAALILDSPAELFTTPWGRLLMAKSAAVAVAGGIGAYNHQVLLPSMHDEPAGGPASERFQWVVRIEAGLVLLAAVLTGFLVAAAS